MQKNEIKSKHRQTNVWNHNWFAYLNESFYFNVPKCNSGNEIKAKLMQSK